MLNYFIISYIYFDFPCVAFGCCGCELDFPYVDEDSQADMRLLVQRYDVHAADIGPKGFQVVEFDEFITDEMVMIPSSAYHQQGKS